MTLLELAERCEKATGPDRELDGQISLAIGKGFNRRSSLAHADTPEEDGGRVIPRYTASLDAAMTLVPEGDSVTLHAHQDDESRASVWWGGHAYDFQYAATPALALCAAALRARAAMAEADTPPAP